VISGAAPRLDDTIRIGLESRYISAHGTARVDGRSRYPDNLEPARPGRPQGRQHARARIDQPAWWLSDPPIGSRRRVLDATANPRFVVEGVLGGLESISRHDEDQPNR
jgi:hypothetical protein